MHGTARTRPPLQTAVAGVDAVVWIEPGRALVVVGSTADETESFELEVPAVPAETPAALAELAHRLRSADRIVVFGTEELRIALEREIVAIGHRPEAIRDESASGRLDEAALIARLRRLP
jgi:hypothetical protein